MNNIIEIDGIKYELNTKEAEKLNLLKKVNTRCKSWNEYYIKYKTQIGYCFKTADNSLAGVICPIHTIDQLTKDDAVAIHALSKLMKLRRDWVGDWDVSPKKFHFAITYSNLEKALNLK